MTDYNGDGLPDILLGDDAVLGLDPPELSTKEKKEHAELEKERDLLNKNYQALYKVAMGHDRTRDKDEAKAAAKAAADEIERIRKRSAEIAEILPRAKTTHGWVWAFIQKPVE